MNVRKMLLLFMSTLFLLFLAACGGDDEPTETTGDVSEEASEAESSSDEVYTFRMNSSFPPPEDALDWAPTYLIHHTFGELLEEKSDGRIKVEVYNSNQLSGQEESLDALARGTFELQANSPTLWAGKIPELSLTALGFWTYGEEHALHILRNTEIGELHDEAMIENGIIPIVYFPTSATGYMSKKPIGSPEDLEGVVINVTSNLTNDYYNELGAGIATVPIAEQFEALMRGTIDAVNYPNYTLETYQLGEVVDYITTPPSLMTSMSMITISEKVWNELPEDLQEIVLEVSEEIEAQTAEGSRRLTERAYEYAEENGIEIVRMTQESYDEFEHYNQELVWKIYEGLTDRTARIVELLKEENEQWLENNPEDTERMDGMLAD